MPCISRPTRLVAALLTLTLAACGDDGTEDAGATFCTVMEQVAARMEPDTGTPTPPDGVRANFDEVVTLLDQAEQDAPAAISDDVAAFATAMDDYVAALAAVDFDLDAIFATPEGTQLAEDTSHALTPDLINHMTGPCGISLG